MNVNICLWLSSLLGTLIIVGGAAASDVPLMLRTEPHHASTELEGGLRGLGAYWEGRGIGAYYAARAQQAWQDAHAKALSNREQQLHLNYETRRLNREARFGRKEPRRWTTEDHARIAKAMAPDRLLPADFAADGSLVWPVVLRGKEFSAVRVEISQWLAGKVRQQGTSKATATPSDYRSLCEALRSEFRTQLPRMPLYEAVPVLKFIDRLTYEGRFLAERSAEQLSLSLPKDAAPGGP